MPEKSKKEKIKYRVKNWSDYNKSLINRGSITFWFSEDTIKNWISCKQTGEQGRPEIYSDEAILCALMIREVYKLPLRMLQGFLKSLFFMLSLNLPVPSYSQISRRSARLNKKLKRLFKRGAKDIVFDSSGLKVYGEGEWKVRQHGTSKRRTWRKIHIGMDPCTGEILLCEMTKNSASDSNVACHLLDEMEGKIERGFGDGAYDDKKFRKKITSKGGKAIVPPDRNAVYKGAIDDAMRQRDLDIAAIQILGGDERARKIWKKLIGYHKRSLGETAFSRIKRILGPNLKARKFENQKVECQVKCLIMNKMLSLGMPISEPILKMAA
jgi:transposase